MPDMQTSCRSGWRVHLSDDVAVIDDAGRALTLRSRKGRALLAFLASAPDHAATRAILIGLLWSDRGHDQARASLRQCVFEIRSEANGLIIVDGERIALAAAEVSEPPRYNGNGATALAGLEHLDPAFDRWLAERRAQRGPGGHVALHPSSPVARPARAVTRPRAWTRPLAALVSIALALAGWLVLRSRPARTPPRGPPVIAIMPFAVTPSDPATRAIAQRLADTAREELPTQRAIVHALDTGDATAAPAAADFIVHGQVFATRDPATLGLRVETRNGLLLWSETREAAHDDLAAAASAIATRLGMVMTCALNGPRGIGRAPEVLAALMNACDKIDSARPNYNNEDALVATRRFVARAPGDPLAHAMLGMGLVVTSDEMPPLVARVALIESERELKRAIALDPRTGTAWLGLGTGLLFRHEFARAETMYEHGLAVEPDEQFLNSFMSELLSEVGRTEEALVYARRAVAISPAALALTANVAERLAWSGQPRAAIDILDMADAAHPKSAFLNSSRLSILIRTGDLVGARALLDRAARIPGFLEPAQEARRRRLIDAAEHPDRPEADLLARDAVTVANTNLQYADYQIIILAVLLRTDAALALAERLPVASAVFEMPQPSPILLSPRFPSAARRAGLWDYWTQTGHWPDICRDPALQWKCGTVKSPSTPR